MFDQWLVVSDMDGTLLNHHDYRVDAAMPLLQKLQDSNVPVIFNTSKTFAELKDWVAELNNRHPFIVENGSAIYIPENYFPLSLLEQFQQNIKKESGYYILLAGVEIETIERFLQQHTPDAIDLTRCSSQRAIDITGLTAQEAEAAQTRQFTVPLMFSDKNKESEFVEMALQGGFGILKGGRFLHVLGNCDKGQSMQLLKRIYQDHVNKSCGLLVLGDSPNDQAMLEQADIPVIVKSPSSETIELGQPEAIYTLLEAPEGWVEGVESALDKNQILLKQE